MPVNKGLGMMQMSVAQLREIRLRVGIERTTKSLPYNSGFEEGRM
jgi:hypothetical protein